jgi:hypothetical protein
MNVSSSSFLVADLPFHILTMADAVWENVMV